MTVFYEKQILSCASDAFVFVLINDD